MDDGSVPVINGSPTSDDILPASQCLDSEIEELDDVEYDIPPVETPPTLESILYDSDGASLSEEESTVPVELFHEAGDSTSVASTSSLDSKGKRYDGRKQRKSPPQNVHGSFLRHVILRGVSAQLLSAAERVHAGMPTAMAVSSMIAVGTSHGIVLIFDVKQALKWCLGGISAGEQYGSVSSLCFNHNCTRLLCGFAKGQITMWDVTVGKILRTVTEAHPLGTAVLHIQFTDDPTLAVCSDSGGSVFELTFKRVMAIRGCDTRCIFSGSRGEVCAIQVLNMIHLKDHPLQEVCIIAMATLSKVIVVSIRPFLKVLFNFPLKAVATTLPILGWQFVVIQVSSTERVIDPVLSFGRESTLYFFQVAATSKDRIQFVPLQTMELQCICLNFLWLNSRTMVVLDTTEHLHVIDVRTKEELEILDLAEVQLVYGSSHFKGLATGGNVSKAMALAGERSCYQSAATYQGQLLLLGTKSIHVMTLRTWNERIDLLVKQSRFAEALALALSFYRDKAKAVVGLIARKEKKKAILAEKMLELMMTFVDCTMATIPMNTRQEGSVEEHFLDAIPLCIEYCIILNRSDLLFGQLYETFSINKVGRSVFLESLEPHILSDALTHISPVVLKEFVEHYEERKLFQALENCLIHLNVETLDFHQVVTLCRVHGLYDAIIYIFNRGMGEYTAPFQELMAILQNEVKLGKRLSNDTIKLGNKLLVYVSCCLAGRAYPLGNIPEDQKSIAKTDMFRCLAVLHSTNAPDDEPSYPYLRTFLHFDTRELLNVLALAFEEPEFCKDTGFFQRQRLVDILLQIMVDGDGFSPSQIGALFTFLARQMAKPDNIVSVNRSLFEQVLEYLTNSGNDGRHAERQQALMELLLAGGLQHYEEEHLLKMADKAGFFQVCELLYERRKEYHNIVTCYLKDVYRKTDVFSFVEHYLQSSELSEVEKTSIESEVVSWIAEIIEIDNNRAARMIISFFPGRVFSILESLGANPMLQYKLLGGLLTIKEGGKSTSVTEVIFLDSSLQEKYIQLMCQFEPHRVLAYVQSVETLKVTPVLQIVEEYEIRDAMAYLLEKMGNVQAAFAIVLENFLQSLHQLQEQSGVIPVGSDLIQAGHLTNVRRSLDSAIQFCQRNSGKVNETEREGLWLPLIEAILMQRKQYSDRIDEEVETAFKEMIQNLLHSMMGYKLPSILEKIIQDPAYGSSKYGEMKELLLGMLETYSYEMIMLNTTKNLVNDELFHQLKELRRSANRGYTSHNNVCSSCGKAIQSSCAERVIIFKCGHSYHERCLGSTADDSTKEQVSDSDVKEWACLLCMQAKRTTVLKDRRVCEQPRIQHHVASHSPGSASGSDCGTRSKSKVHIDMAQVQAIDALKRTIYSPSWVAVEQRGSRGKGRSHTDQNNVKKSVSLQLAPPRDKPLPTEDY